MAHGNVAVIPADQDLATFCYNLPFAVNPCVNRRFSAALAYCFDLRQGIRQFHQPLCTGEEMCEKVCPQAKTQHRQILFIHQFPELVNLFRCEKLCLIRDNHIVVSCLLIGFYNICLRGNHLCMGFQANPAADDICPVSCVNRRLDQPYGHTELFIVKFRNQRLCRFGRPHCPIFKIQLRH